MATCNATTGPPNPTTQKRKLRKVSNLKSHKSTYTRAAVIGLLLAFIAHAGALMHIISHHFLSSFIMAASFDNEDTTYPIKPKAPLPKSKAALEKEIEAINLFDAMREQPNIDAITSKETVNLLPPTHHLTSSCWISFRKHVHSFNGWSTERRLATPEERQVYKVSTKAPVYFVSVSYDPNIQGRVPYVKSSLCPPNKKSQRALAVEAQAIQAFHALRQSSIPTTATNAFSFVLLQPTSHLTDACFKTFCHHVESFAGWTAHRRVATPTEKQALGCTRKTPCFFVSVSFDRVSHEDEEESNTQSLSPLPMS